MTNPAGHEDFVELIYEAAIDTSLWPRVLERLVDGIGGNGATLRCYDMFTSAGEGVGAYVDQAALERGFADFGTVNPLTDKDLANKRRRLMNYRPKINRDIDWLPKEEFLRTPFYNDFFQPFGFHSDVSLGLMCEDVGGGGFEGAGVNVFRHKRKGDWTADEMALCAALHPHFIRAFKLSRRLSVTKGVGDVSTDLLDRSPYGLFMLDRGGRVRHLNRVGEALVAEADGLTIIGGRLAARRHDDTRRLQRLIDLAATGDSEQRRGGAMALTTSHRRRPLSLLISPMRAGRAEPFMPGPAVIVCVTDLEGGVSLSEHWLRELFGLTPAESRVALCLFEGREPREAAQRLGLGLPTVRTHLAHIFEKTGTTGQVALTSLMMRQIGAGPA